MNRWSALAALLLAFAAALALRLPHLDARPLHNDEAVNATKVTELWQTGRYRYDPDEYHGPTLHYATLPFLWLSGAKNANEVKDSTLRLAPVYFGAGLILLLLLFKDALDRTALLWSAIFIAVSPAMVFYSRYFIHEIPLVFFTALLIGAAWRYTKSQNPAWAITVGASLGLMWATKETFVITIAALTLALIGTHLGRARCPQRAANAEGPSKFSFRVERTHLALFLLTFAAIWFLLFSSFLTNSPGLADSIRTYLPWLKRAGGHSPHIHPWYFYLERLTYFHPAKSPIWSEALIIALALIAIATTLHKVWSPGFSRQIALTPRDSKTNQPLLPPPTAQHPSSQTFPIFLTLYTLALTAAYSLISYKTPWCLLSFHWGLILLAGIGASTLLASIRALPLKTIVALALLAATAQLTFQTYRANFDSKFVADRRNPYVYAQTLPDIHNLIHKTEGIAAIAPAHFDTIVKVIAPNGDYWPLPWYLRRFKNIGWYENLPADPYAPLIIVAAGLDARLDEKSDKKWIMVGYTELRPQKFLELYVELDLWKKYVATLPREAE